MKRISQKYILYLILCLVAGGLWIIFCTGRKSVLNTSLSLVLGAYLLNLIFIFFGITFQMGGMIDLDVKDFKKIWWSRVFIFLVASALIAYLIVFRDTNTIKSLMFLIVFVSLKTMRYAIRAEATRKIKTRLHHIFLKSLTSKSIMPPIWNVIPKKINMRLRR